MWKHLIAGLFLSMSTLAVGCATDQEDPEDSEDPTEEVAEAEQAI